MYIVYGTKFKAKRLGYAADFCPICRGIRAMSVREWREVLHLYFIERDSTGSASWELTCKGCGLRRPATNFLITGFSSTKLDDIDDLTQKTNPRILTELAERLDVERKIKEGRIDPSARQELILEPIVLCDLAARWRAQLNANWLKHWLAFVCLIPAPAVFIGSIFVIGPDAPRTMLLVIPAVLIVLAISGVIWLNVDKLYYRRRKLIPLIARSLRALRPNENEIMWVLQSLQEAKIPLASRVYPRELVREIESLEQQRA